MKYIKHFTESNIILYHGSNKIKIIENFKNNLFWTTNDYIAASYAYNNGGLMYETKTYLNPFKIEEKRENLEGFSKGGPCYTGTDNELIELLKKLGYNNETISNYQHYGLSKGVSFIINGNFEPFIDYAKKLGNDSLKFKDESYDVGIVDDTYIIFDGSKIKITNIFDVDWGEYGNVKTKSILKQ